MMGLIYKDFVGSKSKFYLTLLLIASALLCLFKIGSLRMLEWELFVYVAYSGIVMATYSILLFTLDTAIIKTDSSKQIEFYLSTPTSRTGYVLSKYLYFFIAFIVGSCIVYGGLFISMKNMYGEDMLKNLKTIKNFLPYLTGATLIICATEYPFYFAFGVQKGKAIKEGLFIALFFVITVYFFFGNLDVILNMDLTAILKNSKTITKVMPFAFPIGGFILFVLSLFISNIVFSTKKAG